MLASVAPAPPFGIAIEFVQFDVARDGRRRNVRIGFRIGVLDRFLAALLFGDVGDAHGAVCRNDVGTEQDLFADQIGVVDHVQTGLNVRFIRQFHADALVGAVLVGFRGQQDVAARGGVGTDGTHGGLCIGFGPGDVTSTYFVPEHLTARAILTPRKKGVLSGVNVAAEVFRKVDPSLKVEVYLHDGEAVAPGAVIMLIEGSARSILGAERTALNFIQRLSGVASLTRKYVKAVSHTSARILDTRKTTPGYRLLEKAAVAHGGGTNHRMGLYDRAMVKDNHLMTDGNTEHLQKCINTLRAEKPGVEIQLEADTLEQVESFLKLEGVDHILLDNMTPETLRKAVALRGDRSTPLLEASGGVNLDTVAAIAESGVDFVSVGYVTHSAPSLDLGLDFSVE